MESKSEPKEETRTVMHSRVELRSESYALLSNVPAPSIAVIFVHGFYGHPETTWIQFQTLIDDSDVRKRFSWWDDCDLFFYSYDSKQQLAVSANHLSTFLSAVFPAPNWGHLQRIPLLTPRRYERLVLAGHSEGAVLIRACVLERMEKYLQKYESLNDSGATRTLSDDPLLSANVRLFAPALFGSLISGLKGFLLRTPAFGDLVQMCLSHSAAYKQLQPDSPVLASIRTRTIELHNQFPNVQALRAHNLFGEQDATATIWTLPQDLLDLIPDHNHLSICKPTKDYLTPLSFVQHSSVDHDDRRSAVAS